MLMSMLMRWVQSWMDVDVDVFVKAMKDEDD